MEIQDLNKLTLRHNRNSLAYTSKCLGLIELFLSDLST